MTVEFSILLSLHDRQKEELWVQNSHPPLQGEYIKDTLIDYSQMIHQLMSDHHLTHQVKDV